MDTAKIRALLTAADLGSITRAAEGAGIHSVGRDAHHPLA